MKYLENMFRHSSGMGSNPYTVNFISFGGHGIYYRGDDLACINDTRSATDLSLRFINFSA